MVSVFAVSSVVMLISSGSLSSKISFSVSCKQPHLLQRIGGVGHQLAHEDLAVGVERVDDDVEKLADFGLELVLGGFFVGHGGPFS